MRNQVVDVGQVDSGFADHLGDQRRHVLDRHLLQRPGLGVHLRARAHGAGEGEAQPAVLGEGGEADDVDAAMPLGARSTITAAPASPSVSDASCLLNSERICCAAFQLEVGDVLAGNHHAAADLTPGDEVLKDEHPGQHAGARVGEIEVHRLRGADRLLDVQAERRLEGLRVPRPWTG